MLAIFLHFVSECAPARGNVCTPPALQALEAELISEWVIEKLH